MYYTSLTLRNYRSYLEFVVELTPGVNIIVGPNASGKTNLLEAILVVSTGSSYKDKSPDLIYFDKSQAKIESSDGETLRQVKLTNEAEKTLKEVQIDGVIHKKLSLEKTVPITLFEPEHLRMIHGPPELRRAFLDDILNQTIPGFKTLRNHYKRALSQRNRLLKTRPTNIKDQLFVWNIKLSELGAQITGERLKLIGLINESASKIYSKISRHKSSVELLYQSSVGVKDYGSNLLKELEKSTQKDIDRGFTSAGPHREDFKVLLGGHEAGATASRGEIRTIVLTLKIIELTIIEKMRNEKPILLLDDVFSELDSARRSSLAKYLESYQTIITTTDADAIIKNFLGDYNVIALG